MKTGFNSIESVVADLRKGKMVIVVDDKTDRENEGDLIFAAGSMSPLPPSTSWPSMAVV